MRRPTDPNADPDERFTLPAEDILRRETEHFVIHWVDRSEDAAATKVIDVLATLLEDTWQRQIEDLGWPPPAPDGDLGGDARVDVYVVDLGDDEDSPYGYASADSPVGCAASYCDDNHGFMVLDQDYADYEPYPSGAMRATVAHEFAHLVHFAVAYSAPGWVYEATGVWIESLLFPNVDARSFYLADFARMPQLSITDFEEDSGGFDRSYGAYVWHRWLATRHGVDVVRAAWRASTRHGHDVLAGLDEVLQGAGTSFAEEFTAFAAATAGWHVDGAGGFPREPFAYPRVTRAQPLTTAAPVELTLDHTAYAVLDVPVAGAATVTVEGPAGVAGGVGLVAIRGRHVWRVIDATLADGSATVSLAGLADIDALSAVLVNADLTLAEPKTVATDVVEYASDDISYVVTLG